MKKTSYTAFLQEQLRDPEVKREYDAVDVEFALAREIIALRHQRNLTQRELAEKAGTSQPAIARVESGSYRNLSLAFLRRLAAALGAEPEIHLGRRAHRNTLADGTACRSLVSLVETVPAWDASMPPHRVCRRNAPATSS